MSGELEQQRDRLAHVVSQREALVDRIGTGQVKIGSSWENTLRIGHVRAKVKASVARLGGELTQIDQEINITGQARDYLTQIEVRQKQLGEMSELVTEGNLPEEILKQYQQEYSTLVALPDTNPALKRAVERIREEEARRQRQAGPEQPITPPTPVEAPPPQPGAIEPDERRIGSRRFQLPSGEVVGGKVGELLSLLSGAAKENLITSDQIMEALWPEVDFKTGRGRLSFVIHKAREVLSGTGVEIEGILPPVGQRKRTDKGGYYLRREDEQLIPAVEPTRPVESIETRSHLAAEAQRLLDKLTPFDPHHIVTYQELLREVSTQDSQTLHQFLEDVRNVLHPQGFRLAYVPNPREPRNIGYYVESVRKPKVRVILLGDVVRYGHQQVRLSEEEYKLLWALAVHREDPFFDRDLSKRAFNEPNPEASPLAQVTTHLDQRLTELTGAQGIIVLGGNEQFGLWHKIKDARIVRKPGCFPVHQTRLEALQLLFQDNPAITKQEIIRTLGVTKGRRRVSHALTDHQALIALSRAVHRLSNRAEENITTDPETDIYLEMSEYMSKHSITDRKGLIAHIAQTKLGITYHTPAFQTVVEAGDLSPATDVEEQEISGPVCLDEIIRSVEKTEVEVAEIGIAVAGEEVPEEPGQVETAPTAQVVPPRVELVEPKPKAIEQRDPDIRARVNEYLDDILARPEFSAPVTGLAMNRIYQRLKKTTVQKALEGKWLSVPFDKDGHPRFDVVATAALLYLYDYGDNLPTRLRRQVQDVAAEEFKKRQKEKIN